MHNAGTQDTVSTELEEEMRLLDGLPRRVRMAIKNAPYAYAVREIVECVDEQMLTGREAEQLVNDTSKEDMRREYLSMRMHPNTLKDVMGL